jgi:hypothetical protein
MSTYPDSVYDLGFSEPNPVPTKKKYRKKGREFPIHIYRFSSQILVMIYLNISHNNSGRTTNYETREEAKGGSQ